MPSVDKRIVEMRFDNKDFESNVSESISSLDRLKGSLKLGEAARGFDEIGEAADAVTRKFSVLGTIGDQILRNIGNEVYQLKNQFVGLVKSMSVDQITAGMTKYEQKTASVQTIINATGKSIDEVNTYLERLMRYSDETSFGFTDMTSALQTMTSTGGDLDNLIPMLMGIGNAVAYAGKGAKEFSQVMAYGVNQAYSLGYLGTLDWKSFQGSGVGSMQLKQALLDAAKELGTGDNILQDYSLSEFSTALTKKVFTKEVMEKAFGEFAQITLEAEKLVKQGIFEEFSDAYKYIKESGIANQFSDVAYSAALAAQEAKSFTEAIEATKDAVSSGWMTTFEQIFGNYEEAKELWTWLATELWTVFAKGAKARNDMLEAWHEAGYDELWESVQNIWYGLRGIGGRIKVAWEEIFPSLTVEKLLNATHKFHEWSEKFVAIFGPVEDAIESVSAGAEKLRGFIDPALAIFHTEEAEEFVETLDSASDSVTRLANTIRDLDILTSKVWAGDYGVGWDRWNQLEEEGYNWQLVQNEVNAQADCAHRFEIAQEDLDAATRLLNGDLEKTANNSEDVGDAMDEMSDAVEKSRSWLLDLRDVVGGVKSAFDLLVEAGKLVAKYILIPAWNFLVDVFKKGLAVLAPFSRAFTDFVNRLKESGAITRNIKNFREWFRDLIEATKNSENVQRLLEHFDHFKTWIGGIKAQALNKITEFFDKIVNLDIDFSKWDITKVVGWIDTAAEWINKGLDKLKDVEKFWPKIKAFFEGLDFSGVQSFAESAATGVSAFFQTLFADKDLKETSKGWFDQIWAGLKERFSEVDWGEVVDILVKGLGGAALLKFTMSISNFFQGGADVLDKFSTRISKLFKGITKAVNASAILMIAMAILALAGAMIMLSKIPSDRLPQVAVDISVVILALSVLAKALGSTKLFGQNIESGNINAKVTVFSKLGTVLLGFALVIGSIVIAIKAINKIKANGGDIWAGVKVITAVLSLFTLMILALKGISQIGRNSSYNMLQGDNFGKQMLSMAGAFAIIAVALDIMLPALASLTGLAALNNDALNSAFWKIAGIMVAFGLLILASRISKPASLLAMSVTLMALAICLNLLLPVFGYLELLASENPDGFKATMLSIIGLLGTFAIAIGILGILPKNAALKGSAAILAMAAAMVVITKAMNSAKGMKWSDIQTFTLLLGGIVVVLTLLGALAGMVGFGVIALGMMAVGAAMLLLGAGIALVGAGAKDFAEAMTILANSSVDAKKAGKNLAEGVGSFFEGLNENMDSILAFVTKVVGAIIGLLILKKADIVNTGTGIVTALGGAIKANIGSNKLLLFGSIALLVGELLEYLGFKSDIIADSLVKMVVLLMDSVAVAIIDNKDIIMDALRELYFSARDIFGELIKNAEDALAQVVSIFAGKNAASNHALSNLWNLNTQKMRGPDYYDEYGRAVYAASGSDRIHKQIEEVRKGLEEDAANFRKESELLQESAKQAEENQIKYNPALAGMVDAALVGTEAEKKAAMEGALVGDAYFDSILETANGQYLDLETIFANLPEGWAEGMAAKAGLVGDSTDDIVDLIFSIVQERLDMHSPSRVAMDWGNNIDSGLANGIVRSSSIILTAMKRLIQIIVNQGKEIGRYFDEGFANGINMYSYIIEKAAENAGRKAVAGAKKGTDSNSPSKEGKKIGRFFDQGIALGIDENDSLIFNAAEGVGSGAIAAIQDVISRISTAMNSDWDMNPVIRPVLDLSEIQNGQARIGSVLGYGGYAFSPNLGYGMERAFGIQSALTGYLGRDSSAYGSVGMMQTQIAELTEQNQTMMGLMRQYLPYIPELANMQVVTDRGTLVGELAPMMNDRLGKIAAKSRR